MRAFALWIAISIVIVLLGGWVLGMVFATPQGQRAVWVSGAVAFAVQVATFAVLRAAANRNNVIAGWGLGALLRLVALVVYGFVVVPALGLALEPAMIALAVFLFVSIVIEPLLLKVGQ